MSRLFVRQARNFLVSRSRLLYGSGEKAGAVRVAVLAIIVYWHEREREALGVQQDCVFGKGERDDSYEAQTASTSSSKLLEKLAPRIATWYLFVEERATE